MNKSQNKECVPVDSSPSSSSPLSISPDSSTSTENGTNISTPCSGPQMSITPECQPPVPNMNLMQNQMQFPQPTPQIVSHFLHQDPPPNIGPDVHLLPIPMPQQPIQIHHIQQPVQPHLLTGINLKQEPLDYSKDSLQHINCQQLQFQGRPVLPKTGGQGVSNPTVKKPRGSSAAGRDLNADTKDLIFSAISVMKNRKARPDAKRISSWINRRYGRSVHIVNDELNKLVETGELARVDYKGSSSFRINSPIGKTRRKRKVLKTNQDLLEGASLPLAFLPGPDGSPPQLSLHLLVMELLGEPNDYSVKIPVNTQTISAAVKSSSREFVRSTVLENLDLLLNHEVEKGNFIKMDAENFLIIPRPTLRQIPLQTTFTNQRNFPQLPQHPILPSSMSQEQTFLHSLPTSPLPPNQMVSTPLPFTQTSSSLNVSLPSFRFTTPELKMHSGLQFQQTTMVPMVQPASTATAQNVQLLLQNCTIPLPNPQNHFPSGNSFPGGATLTSGGPHHLRPDFQLSNTNSQQSFEINSDKTDDQIKNDLIRYQLSKLGNKDQRTRSPSKKFTEPFMKRLDSQDTINKLKSFRKKKGEAPVMEISFDNFNGYGSNKQQGQTPQINYLFHQNGNSEASSPSSCFFLSDGASSPSIELSIPESRGPNSCIICKLGSDPFPLKIADAMLNCKNCNANAHSGCLKLSEDLTYRIITQQMWLCNSCRQCAICRRVLSGEHSLNCKNCDFRIHLNCLAYPLILGRSGEWECQTCVSARILQSRQPQLTVSVVTNGHQREKEFLAQKLATFKYQQETEEVPTSQSGANPKWDEFEQEKSVPDISSWSSVQLSKFFSDQGFPNDVCRKFIDLEVDGLTVLIMRRQDVIDGMGLKLGKAIHVFSYVKQFQLAHAFK